ncbi:MAG: hypothetical protein ACYDAZ_04415 [Thermoplasmataceae archaeon]
MFVSKDEDEAASGEDEGREPEDHVHNLSHTDLEMTNYYGELIPE